MKRGKAKIAKNTQYIKGRETILGFIIIGNIIKQQPTIKIKGLKNNGYVLSLLWALPAKINENMNNRKPNNKNEETALNSR